MANVVKHPFTSGKSDGADATKVQPTDWNAAHAFSGGALGSLLYRDTGQADGANWLAAPAVNYELVSNGAGAALSFRAKPVFNVKDYGAAGNGSADDTSAIQAAIAALVAAGGGVLYFPPGTYNVSGELTIDSVSVAVIGEGPGVSIIHRTDAGNVLTIRLYQDAATTVSRRAIVRGLKITTAVANTTAGVGRGLSIVGTTTQVGTKMAIVRDVVISSPTIDATNSTQYFHTGFYASNVWGLRMDAVHVAGHGTYGYHVTGYCVDSTWTACYALFPKQVGFYVQFTAWGDGTPEGICFYNCHGLGHQIGLHYDMTNLYNGGTGYQCPWLTVDCCHWNVYDRTGSGDTCGVRVTSGSSVFITNNLIFNVYTNTLAFRGIDLVTSASNPDAESAMICKQVKLEGNDVYMGASYNGQYGFYIRGYDVTAKGNSFSPQHANDVCIYVHSLSKNVRLAENTRNYGFEGYGSLYSINNTGNVANGTSAAGACRDVTYASGNFTTSNVGLTWTVGSGDQESFYFVRDGEHVTVHFFIGDSALSGSSSANDYLKIALPDGMTVGKRTQSIGHGYYTKGGGAAATQQFLISAIAGETFLRLYTLDSSSWDAGVTYVGGQISFDIQ